MEEGALTSSSERRSDPDQVSAELDSQVFCSSNIVSQHVKIFISPFLLHKRCDVRARKRQ